MASVGAASWIGDLLKSLTQITNLIQSHPDYKSPKDFPRMLIHHENLLLASPAPELGFFFGEHTVDVTFVQLNKCYVKNTKVLELDHLWKTRNGYALVKDLVTFNAVEDTPMSCQKSPTNHRLITILNEDQSCSNQHRIKVELTTRNGNLVTNSRALSPPEEIARKDEVNATPSKSPMSFSTSDSEWGEPHTPIYDDEEQEERSDWLMDFNDPPLQFPTLKTEKDLMVDFQGALAANTWNSAKVLERREAAIRSREAELEQLQQDITERVAILETREHDMDVRERNIQASWTRYGTFYFETQDLEANLREREFDINQRESDITLRETTIANLEEKAKAQASAELKDRIYAAELLEESVAIRNEELKAGQENLHTREQWAILDRSELKKSIENVTRREEKVKKREIAVRGAENVVNAREAAVQADIVVLLAKEAAIKADTTILVAREAGIESAEKAIKCDQNALNHTAKHVQKQRSKADTEMTTRELEVLKREQRAEILDAELEIEREMIRTRYRDEEEMKEFVKTRCG